MRKSKVTLRCRRDQRSLRATTAPFRPSLVVFVRSRSSRLSSGAQVRNHFRCELGFGAPLLPPSLSSPTSETLRFRHQHPNRSEGIKSRFKIPVSDFAWRLTGPSFHPFDFQKSTICSRLRTFAFGVVSKSDQRSASTRLPIRTGRSRASPLMVPTI